jgi:hypothetical protein
MNRDGTAARGLAIHASSYSPILVPRRIVVPVTVQQPERTIERLLRLLLGVMRSHDGLKPSDIKSAAFDLHSQNF